MQIVSDAYKLSMKSLLRNQGYMMITFGLFNQEAQANATTSSDQVYWSNTSKLFDDDADTSILYATVEGDFTKVDGSMYFVPVENGLNIKNTGFISDDLVYSDNAVTLVLDLNISAIDIKGLTIQFGEYYPTAFTVTTSEGVTTSYTNDGEEFYTEDVFENTTSLTLVFTEMLNEYERVRITSIKFGYGLVYKNNSIMDSTLKSYCSPISEDVPQIDFEVKLKNYDQYFNVDNPDSAFNFLETGQEMDICYGYELDDGTIEWIQGQHLYCSEWESDDSSATIKCQDILRNMDTEYTKGVYSADGTSYYDLALAILDDAGVEDYYIDPRLETLYCKNPIPRVSHKEALQMIANATRCVLSQTREGEISIKSNFIFNNKITLSSNDEADWSSLSAVQSDTDKVEYALMDIDYTRVDGSMYFLPTDNTGGLSTGYVSDSQSLSTGEFSTNPVIILTSEAAYTYYGLSFVFGMALPTGMIIRTYNDGTLIDEYVVEDEYKITQELEIDHDFIDFDILEIEFTETATEYNRIKVNYISFGDTADFKIERRDITSDITATKQEQIKDITVVQYVYQNATEQDSLVSEDVEIVEGDTTTYYFSDAVYDIIAEFNESSGNVTITDSGAYYVTLKFLISGTYRLDIYGYKYVIAEKQIVYTLNDRGTSVTWENPLVDDSDIATDLAEWLGDYYAANIEYEYETRGNPELDVNDIIYQENDFDDELKVNVYDYDFRFKQVFSGNMVVRRIHA